MNLTAEQNRILHAVAGYEERYSKGLWVGRDGTTTETLDGLVDLGLLRRIPDEHRLRNVYRLTAVGHDELARG